MNNTFGFQFLELIGISAAACAAVITILFFIEHRKTTKSLQDWQFICFGVVLFPIIFLSFTLLGYQNILGWVLFLISQTSIAFGFFKMYLVDRRRSNFIDEIKEQDQTSLDTVALFDPLTRLPNQRQFDTKLRIEYQKNLRDHKSIAVIALVIDDYKALINSHNLGSADVAVQHIAWILEKSVRDFDIVARTSPDGFHILLQKSDAQDSALIAERIRNKVAGLPAQTKDQSIQMTVSLGVTVLSENSTAPISHQALLKAADTALLLARQKGGDRVIVS